MATQMSSSPAGQGSQQLYRAEQAALPDMELLRPMLAGARARGMADAMDMLGVAAVMLDRQGMILFVSKPALDLMGQGLLIISGHLVSSQSDANLQLETLVASVMGASSTQENHPEIVLSQGVGKDSLRIRAIRVENAGQDDCQLLKAVIVIERIMV